MQAGGHQAVRHATCIYAARQTLDIRSASSQLRVVHENIDTAAPLCVDDAATRLVDIHVEVFFFPFSLFSLVSFCASFIKQKHPQVHAKILHFPDILSRSRCLCYRRTFKQEKRRIDCKDEFLGKCKLHDGSRAHEIIGASAHA